MDKDLLRSVRQEAREHVWGKVTDKLAREERALRPYLGRLVPAYLEFVAGVSVGIAIGIMTMVIMYIIPVFFLHLDIF